MAVYTRNTPRALVLTTKGLEAIGVVRVPLLRLPLYKDKKR